MDFIKQNKIEFKWNPNACFGSIGSDGYTKQIIDARNKRVKLENLALTIDECKDYLIDAKVNYDELKDKIEQYRTCHTDIYDKITIEIKFTDSYNKILNWIMGYGDVCEFLEPYQRPQPYEIDSSSKVFIKKDDDKTITIHCNNKTKLYNALLNDGVLKEYYPKWYKYGQY